MVATMLITSMILIACGQEFDRFTPSTSEIDTSELDDLLDLFQKEAPTYTINSERRELVVTPRENVFIIPSKIFQTKDGIAVSGNIDLQVVELFSKGDMLLNGVPTVSDSRLIVSDGVFNIKAFQDGEELELIPGKQIELYSPNENVDLDMQLFYGNDAPIEEFNWTLNPPVDSFPTLNFGEWGFETQEGGPIFGDGYECILDSMNWINIDAIADFDGQETTGITVELPEEYQINSTLVAIIFKDLDSVVALAYNEENKQFIESYELTPISYEVSIIVLSLQPDETLHFAMEDVTVTQDLNVEMMPQETTIEIIKEALGNL